MIVSPEIIKLFTNKDYWDSTYCLVPLSISVFGEMLYCLPANIEYFNKKTTFIMWGTISATIINIILDIGFVYIFGYVGAAYATSLSKLLLFAFHYSYLQLQQSNNHHCLHSQIHLKKIYFVLL